MKKTKPVVVMIKVQGVECQRCGYQWVPRSKDVRQCPKCRSVRFDQPLKKTA